MQIDLVSDERVSRNLHVREETVSPVSLHGVCYLRAGQLYALSDREAGDAEQHIVFVAFYTRDRQSAYSHLSRVADV